MTKSRLLFSLFQILLLAPICASAQEFALVVTPPRFEDRVTAGSTYRNVIEINNTSQKTARFTVQTADWTLDARGSAVFTQKLAPDSCRPWVGLEATDISIKGNAKRRYRFETKVPPGATDGECTFAIMIEGEPQIVGGQAAIPVSGRIGVIVYLAIGNAAPSIKILKNKVSNIQGQEIPVLHVQNSGNMHTRLEGFLNAIDAKGKRLVLVPDNSPILIGASRDIPLHPQPEDKNDAAPTISYPLRVKGRLDSGKQKLDIEMTFTK
jgi:fimbrial chaperone protein